ncbi:hypothetical protein J7413_12005 [Shimia sp. R10_1]|uniref:hypothetical protein n=1 Tax=Shimia sp. R10_1 TaxID=2821095 RepID=UPI001AD9F305|nr:hypothetical protein [Shimia sp. R10_1]MBO9474265.1 hypothetical protein [Shimia sp. R10_1]
MRVSATEHGLVRLFAVDLPPEQIAQFRDMPDDSEDSADWPVAKALGATTLDAEFVELFDLRDLEDLGLTGYMVEGLGIAAADVKEDAARLASQKGWMLVVLSSAFEGVAQTLTPKSPLRWIGTYKEETAPVQFSLLPDASAKGAPLPPEDDPTPAPAPRSPYLTLLVALVALPLCAAFLGLLILWMIG